MINHEYETIYVSRAELADDDKKRIHERFTTAIAKFEGTLLIHEDWGRRKLAYPIDRQTHGHYVYLNYVGPAEIPIEIERINKLEDALIRFLTVRLEANVDKEDLIANAEEKRKARAAAKAASAAALEAEDDLDEDDGADE